ncbi:OPT/YSL family transporter [Sedimentitalea sp. JM2-8]|uniref:OPT/YSL family transporter n=1 Tax=Sedimentitalea xiamensis TaxID=3050037 RepID=A0ABT7FLD5_9RHOB|nr:OPT/YSL family transporter [Sedimentitalea xiamensis]MDK3075868.1 OPT/YSL family transporter [Sedimentitalea xiamensis]
MSHIDIQSTTGRAAQHPRALAPDNLVLTIILSVLGAIIGIQLLASLGITPSTSLIGALAAMALARIPLSFFRGFRSIHAQNLAQTSISSATFGAANTLFLPIGIPFLFGLPNMIQPMLIGVSLALLLDAWLLYRMFNTPAFPAKSPWPPGVAAAEAIKAGDKGGKQAKTLLAGLGFGVAGAFMGLPMSAFGVALIAGLASMVAFASGLLIRGYSLPLFDLEISAMYIPHGMMIGAGLVALWQVGRVVMSSHGEAKASKSAEDGLDQDGAARLGRSLRIGGIGYLLIALLLAFGTGIYTGMSVPLLIGFLVFAAVAAFVHELIVGIAAMHSGWFPAFAVALITLIIGILIGFPPEALVVLAGFSAATGPAFADMGYDLKTGYMLRGDGADPAFELEGRKQQLIAGMIGFACAIVVVLLSYQSFFDQGMTAPINAAYVAAINAGMSPDTAVNLLIWAIPGAILQFLGGSGRQIGILFATGLLINFPPAGWMVATGVLCRLVYLRLAGADRRDQMEVFAGGVIAGDALYSFFSSGFRAFGK